MQIKIAPSMVESDLCHMADAVRELEEGGVDILHVDVADGHFAPSFMLGPYTARALVQCATVPVGAHLMIDEPLRYAPMFAEGGVDHLFAHVEVLGDVPAGLRELKDMGVRPGLALLPETPAEAVREAVGLAECLLILTVQPGFSGQSFGEQYCRKAVDLRRMFGPDIDIYVDGGIRDDTLPIAVRYGVNVMVAGYAVFRTSRTPGQAVQHLKALAAAL